MTAWLRDAGADVSVQDLSISDFDADPIRAADMIAFYVPMHTATRLAEPVLAGVKGINADAHISFFGLYAPINEGHLRDLGADSVLGGEFEEGLVAIYERVVEGRQGTIEQSEPIISHRRQNFLVPDRTGLPSLDNYARLQVSPDRSKLVGYTEATRGCKHLCRHCPVVPVYGGRFVVVQPDVVLEDVRRQVHAGAEHITFGDPDFFNGPRHAMRIVTSMHREFPDLTYDVTIKVEHLAQHTRLLVKLKETGCALVTSAVESFDDRILGRFDKRHSRHDLDKALGAMRDVGLALNPTFVTFTPWTTLDGYIEFLETLAALDLVENISPVQYAIRLLIPAGSKLMDLSDVADLVEQFDDRELVYPWRHRDPAVDELFADVLRIAQQSGSVDRSRVQTFNEVWEAAHTARGVDAPPLLDPHVGDVPSPVTIPYLTEPWYC
ncbi:MAG: CUAEP/CCAEP-tail radical SAM protein [Actinomycetia bacterium]|nr:CUAEP/CCAEP-tail radical SAM protein [Actinomycetes bacterium]